MAFETETQRAEIVARVWEDPEYKKRLLADPKAALAEMGVEVPDSVDLKVVETTPSQSYFVLPPEPSSDLTEEELEMVAGGMGAPCCAPCQSSSRLTSIAKQRLGSDLRANTFIQGGRVNLKPGGGGLR